MVNWQLVIDKLNYFFTVRGWDPEFTLRGNSIQSRDCTSFVITGRGPGKMPPIEPIREWVQKKGIESGVEWAIAKNISKYGTKRKNLTTAFIDYVDEVIDKYVIPQIIEDVYKSIL